MSQAEILRLEGVTRQYAKNLPAAVSRVTFSLQQGDLLGLLGSSGCGKTTLLRIIAGFEHPQAGTVILNDETIVNGKTFVPPEQRDIGMVFQDYALFPHLTVAKNVAFGLMGQKRGGIGRLSAKKIWDLVADAIDQVGLHGLENRYPHELSGGQQQRVALARALAPRPALILLDEPLSNLDAQVRLKLREEIRAILKTSRTSAIFVTHDQEEALSISDWVAVMQQGQIEQFDTPEAIYQEPASRFVAQFVTQANFLPAQFNGSAWETEIGCFTEHSSLITHHSSLNADLMIRQEDLRLEPDETAAVVVCDRQFLGREQRYCLQTPSGHILHARVTNRQALSIDTKVKLLVNEKVVRVFPRQN